jgi:hypothetical protein
MTPDAHRWQRCDRCGFATGLMGPDEFAEHECLIRTADPTAPRLWPLFHTCGAIALYSKVPLRKHMRVPPVDQLLLHDGRTPMWTPTRSLLLGRARPKAPNCPACGETTNRALRSEPVRN